MKPAFAMPLRKHFVHKAIEPRKLSKSAAYNAACRSTTDRWELKFDGCNVILIKANGHAYAFSRTGEPVMGAMDRQIKAMEECAVDNYVLFAEAWNPTMIHSDINGEFRTHLKEGEQRNLGAMVFDSVRLDEFMQGRAFKSLHLRRLEAHDIVCAVSCYDYTNCFSFAESFDSREEAVEAAIKEREKGLIFALDGFMRKDYGAGWTAGAGSGGEVLKDKEIMTVDIVVTGLVEGEGKFAGTLGAYEALYKGQPQRIGGGALTNVERDRIWADKTSLMGGVGSVIEVHALGESTHGLLREPRFARFRPDKKEGE